MPHRATTAGIAEDAVVEAAKGGDEAAFAELVGRYRRELHVHCYRMLGSFEEAEDLVQETFLRAWRRRDSFEGGPGSGPGCTGSRPTPAWTRCGAAGDGCRRCTPSPRSRGSSRTRTGCWTSWRRATPSRMPWSWPGRPSGSPTWR